MFDKLSQSLKKQLNNLKDDGSSKFNKVVNNFQNQIDIKKDENNKYKELIEETTTFQNLYPMIKEKNDVSEHKIYYIMQECPDIYIEKAEIIANLIPINEAYLQVTYSKEVQTNLEYFIVATDKYLWIISTVSFGAYPYQNLSCKIIKNSLMTKVILFNNILLEVYGTNSSINNLVNIINDANYRSNKARLALTYLCGITPIYQKINKLGSGISIDKNNTVIIHAQNRNYKYQITDIIKCEIYLDDEIYTPKKDNQNNTSEENKNDNAKAEIKTCTQISLRVTTKDKSIITMPLLVPTTLSSKYNEKDPAFQKSINFANAIITKLGKTENTTL